MPDLALDPARTALLVMDFQDGVVGRFPEADGLIDRVAGAIADVRGHGGHVGWVRVAFSTAEFEAIPASSVMAAMTPPGRRPGWHVDAHTTRIHHRLAPRPDDVSVRKTRVGAFTTTDLDDQLRSRQIDTVVLAGLSTSGVVLSTVREAMDRDYRIVVLRDATADLDPGVHDFLIERIFARYATVTDVDGVRSMWGAAAAS